STAASTALLMQEPDKDFHELATRYGHHATQRIWRLSREATSDLVRTLRRLRISCGLVKRDSVYFTTDEARVKQLDGEFRHRRGARLDCTWLDAAALHRLTGI